mgnify:FL=1
MIRFGLFGAVFAGLLFADIAWWIAALFATVIAFAVSYIFLAHQRDELAADIKARVEKRGMAEDDAESEDGAVASPGESNS